MGPVETGDDRSDISIHSTRLTPGNQALAPFKQVILCNRLKFHAGKHVIFFRIVQIENDSFETPCRLLRRTTTPMTPKVGKIRLEGRAYSGALYRANGGTGKLPDPTLRAPLCLIELKPFTEGVI